MDLSATRLVASVHRLLGRLLGIGVNRLELLVVELEEERDRLIVTLLLVLAIAGLGLLALVAASAAVVVLLWPYAPLAALFGLAAIYGLAAVVLILVLVARLRSSRPLAATFDQLAKDRAALEGRLS